MWVSVEMIKAAALLIFTVGLIGLWFSKRFGFWKPVGLCILGVVSLSLINYAWPFPQDSDRGTVQPASYEGSLTCNNETSPCTKT